MSRRVLTLVVGAQATPLGSSVIQTYSIGNVHHVLPAKELSSFVGKPVLVR